MLGDVIGAERSRAALSKMYKKNETDLNVISIPLGQHDCPRHFHICAHETSVIIKIVFLEKISQGHVMH